MEKGKYIKVERTIKNKTFKFWVIFDSLYNDDYFWGTVDNDVNGYYQIGDKQLFKINEAKYVSDHKHFKYRLRDKIRSLETFRTTGHITYNLGLQ